MSYQVFVSDLKKETLTVSRLQQVWEFCNLKNKSSLIDILTRTLYAEMKKRADTAGISMDDVQVPADDVCRICDRFYDAVIKKEVPPTVPLVEPLPLTVRCDDTTWRYNPPTGIVFKPHDRYKWVAVRAMKGTRLYPLNVSHLLVCTSNGWYFHTTMDSVTSPYRVYE
jgi:hypothetical protein